MQNDGPSFEPSRLQPGQSGFHILTYLNHDIGHGIAGGFHRNVTIVSKNQFQTTLWQRDNTEMGKSKTGQRSKNPQNTTEE